MSKPTPQYQCHSYYQDGEIRDCTCGKCGVADELFNKAFISGDKEADELTLSWSGYNAILAATAQAARQEGDAEAIRMVHGRHGITCEKCFDEADVAPQSEVCVVCGKQDKTVHERECGYTRDINGTENMEVICDACEHEHLMDI